MATRMTWQTEHHPSRVRGRSLDAPLSQGHVSCVRGIPVVRYARPPLHTGARESGNSERRGDFRIVGLTQ